MEDAEVRQRVYEILSTYDTDQVFLDVNEGEVRLAGQVSSDGVRREIGVVVSQLEGVRAVRNDLHVEYVDPEGAHLTYHPERASEMQEQGGEVAGQGTEIDLNEELGARDVMEASSEAEPYFPATDLVVRPAPETSEGFEVVGGFSDTSMDEVSEGQDSVSSVERGDEAIADDVRRELREDSLTTDLDIRVYVRQGVVYLRGTVATIDDAEAAEEVAARVPGVAEVREELEVAA